MAIPTYIFGNIYFYGWHKNMVHRDKNAILPKQTPRGSLFHYLNLKSRLAPPKQFPDDDEA
uniref:Uncharacterized protein n=1 Tax=Romanomermis culicivorax TaxID=13658 RepID=A0A915IJ09_ROMCU